MITEAEAKTKWCPLARVGEQASGAAENRPDGSYNCIASACMAWRWGPQTYRRFIKARDERRTSGGEFPLPHTPPSYEWSPFNPSDPEQSAGWFEPEEETRARRQGRCGLAGDDHAVT